MDAVTAETFLVVLEVGSFSRAAEILNVTQSTISARIKVLEEQLGRRLLTRSKAGVAPTQAGLHFKPFAETMVWTWRRGKQEVLLPARFKSVIAVGGQYTLWDELLLNWIPWMRKSHPDIALRAEVATGDSLTHHVIEGLLDIAVMYTPRSRPNLEIEQLFEEELLYVSTSPTASVQEDSYVHIDWGVEFAEFFSEAYPRAEMTALTVSHGQLALQHILDLGGSGYFPQRFVYHHIQDGTLFAVEDAPRFYRPVHLVYLTGRTDKTFQGALKGLRDIALNQHSF